MAKKKKNDNLEKVSEFFKDVKEKRETVPGYDSFYKLVLWSIFILVILILIFVYGRTPVEIVPAGNKTTLPANAFSYKELLENRIKDGNSYIVNVDNNGVKSRFECTIKENTITGISSSIASLLTSLLISPTSLTLCPAYLEELDKSDK